MCYVSCLPKIMCCMTTVLFLNIFFFCKAYIDTKY